MKNIETVFKAIDKDGSGDLDYDEFQMAMNRLGLGLSAVQVQQCIEVLDKDGDGEVSLDEFMALVQRPVKAATKAISAASAFAENGKKAGTAKSGLADSGPVDRPDEPLKPTPPKARNKDLRPWRLNCGAIKDDGPQPQSVSEWLSKWEDAEEDAPTAPDNLPDIGVPLVAAAVRTLHEAPFNTVERDLSASGRFVTNPRLNSPSRVRSAARETMSARELGKQQWAAIGHKYPATFPYSNAYINIVAGDE